MKLERITPRTAKTYLNDNKSNRALRSGLVEKYAADMKAGAWTQCLAPIAFYEDGDVADGQHRLWALIEAGTPQEFYVLRGISRDAALNIDTGAGRTIVDNATIAGRGEGLNNTIVALCSGIELGNRAGRGNTNSQKMAYVEKHLEAAKWAEHHGTFGKLLRNAPTNSAIARAWYVEEDKERLALFGNVVSKGFANGTEDSAAIAIRNYLLSHGGNSTSSGLWRDTFLKTQHACWMFMRRKPLMVIKAQSEERYPLLKAKRA